MRAFTCWRTLLRKGRACSIARAMAGRLKQKPMIAQIRGSSQNCRSGSFWKENETKDDAHPKNRPCRAACLRGANRRKAQMRRSRDSGEAGSAKNHTHPHPHTSQKK